MGLDLDVVMISREHESWRPDSVYQFAAYLNFDQMSSGALRGRVLKLPLSLHPTIFRSGTLLAI